MISEVIVVRGTLNADGTLTLADIPTLPPGPVQVTLVPLPAARSEPRGWFDYLRQARAELEAAGHTFRTQEEIDAELEDLRADRDDLRGLGDGAGSEELR